MPLRRPDMPQAKISPEEPAMRTGVSALRIVSIGNFGMVASERRADTPVRTDAASASGHAASQDLAGGTGDADKSVRAPISE